MIYNIEATRGCTTDCISVNSQNTADMTHEQLAQIITALLNAEYFPDIATMQSFIEEIAEYNGEITTLYHCDQCGDTVTQTTLKATV